MKNKNVLTILCTSDEPNATKYGLDTWIRPMNLLEILEYRRSELRAFNLKNGNRFLASETKQAKIYEKKLVKLQDAVADAYTDCLHDVAVRIHLLHCPTCGDVAAVRYENQSRCKDVWHE